MKYLFIAPNIYPDVIGGAEVFNYYFSKELSKNSDVTVMTCSNYNEKGVHTHRLRKMKPARLFTNVQIFFSLLLSTKKTQVVVLSYMRTSWVNWIIYPFLHLFTPLKYIIIIHGGGFHEWKPKFIHKALFKRAMEIFAVSDRACKEYKKRSGRVIRYLPPLTPLEQSSLEKKHLIEEYKLDAQARYMLYVGSIKKIKGSGVLVEAFLQLDPEVVKKTNIKLLIAGDGAMKRELIELKNKAGMGDSITFLGNVKREKIPDLYKLSDYFVIPSQFENLSMSLLEAMYNSKPIIGAKSPGIADMMEDTEDALLFNTDDPGHLKEKIEQLLLDDELADKISARANAKYKRDYNYSEMIKEFKTIVD